MHAPVETPLNLASVITADVLSERQVPQRGRNLINLFHAGAHGTAAHENQHVAFADLALLDGGNGVVFRNKRFSGTAEAKDAVLTDDRRIDGGTFHDRSFGSHVAQWEANRRGESASMGDVGRHDDVIRINAVQLCKALAEDVGGARSLPTNRERNPEFRR